MAWETPAPTPKSPRDLGSKPLCLPGHVSKKLDLEPGWIWLFQMT